MKLQILSLAGTLFEGETNSVSLPSSDGEITVLPEHIPLITLLQKGEIKFNDQKLAVEGGFAEIDGEKVVVLAN
jgi:F-type H+-transporting ATPase subunit epsilon